MLKRVGNRKGWRRDIQRQQGVPWKKSQQLATISMPSLTFTPISKYKLSQPPFIPPHIASLSFIDLPEGPNSSSCKNVLLQEQIRW